MSVYILEQEATIRRFFAYCQRAIENAQVNVYKFLTRNASRLVSITALPHDVPDPIELASSIGTPFRVSDHTIMIEDDVLAAALKKLPSDSVSVKLIGTWQTSRIAC